MQPATLPQLASLLGARIVGDEHAVNACEIRQIGIDTRSLEAGSLYVALRGERFDGHDFAEAARCAGAAALVLERELTVPVPQLLVRNTRKALGELARAHASRCAAVTVAITGSNGKTTVKEMVGSILREVGDVCVTAGNRNNEIGVPLTLLALEPRHRFLVLEMGANHAGEIAELVKLVNPHVAVVTNVEAAHLEGFGSLEQVAAAKAEIFRGLDADGLAVINTDNRFAHTMRAATAHCRRLQFGFSTSATVRGVLGAELTILHPGGQFKLRLALPGRHNAMNALAASAVALGLGIDPVHIIAGLQRMRGVAERLEHKQGLRGSRLIDDTYNANPASVQAAVDVLACEAGRRVFVLGDMAELGADAPRLHAQAGAHMRKAGIDELLTVGPLSKAAGSAFGENEHYDDVDSLIAALAPRLGAGYVVLVKGSRSARMERVVQALEQPVAPSPGSTESAAERREEPSA